MSQLLNLVFDSSNVRLFRSNAGNSVLLDEIKIESSAFFFLENLKELIRKNHQHPELIRIYFSPEKYTLIPSSVFLPSKTADYFQLNFEANNSENKILSESILPIGAVVVYSIPSWILDLKNEINAFGDVKTILGRNLIIQNENKSLNLITCSIENDKMDVLVKSSGKLLLANQYEVQNEEDVIYFLLSIVQKLNLLSSASLRLYSNSVKINLDRFNSIFGSIQELSELSIEQMDNNIYFNSMLCA
ncbi:MAG: DUF3822 family protein [Bacteroidetes bacterium]|nr:DUF3822 family protein [Bacteroidota bacterium]